MVRELRSYMLCGTAKINKIFKKERNQNYFRTAGFFEVIKSASFYQMKKLKLIVMRELSKVSS